MADSFFVRTLKFIRELVRHPIRTSRSLFNGIKGYFTGKKLKKNKNEERNKKQVMARLIMESERLFRNVHMPKALLLTTPKAIRANPAAYQAFIDITNLLGMPVDKTILHTLWKSLSTDPGLADIFISKSEDPRLLEDLLITPNLVFHIKRLQGFFSSAELYEIMTAEKGMNSANRISSFIPNLQALVHALDTAKLDIKWLKGNYSFKQKLEMAKEKLEKHRLKLASPEAHSAHPPVILSTPATPVSTLEKSSSASVEPKADIPEPTSTQIKKER